MCVCVCVCVCVGMSVHLSDCVCVCVCVCFLFYSYKSINMLIIIRSATEKEMRSYVKIKKEEIKEKNIVCTSLQGVSLRDKFSM